MLAKMRCLHKCSYTAKQHGGLLPSAKNETVRFCSKQLAAFVLFSSHVTKLVGIVSKVFAHNEHMCAQRRNIAATYHCHIIV